MLRRNLVRLLAVPALIAAVYFGYLVAANWKMRAFMRAQAHAPAVSSATPPHDAHSWAFSR